MNRKIVLRLIFFWIPLVIAPIIYFRFGRNKIEIIHKNSKEVIYSIYGNQAEFYSKSEPIFLDNHKTYILADSSKDCKALKQPPRVDVLNIREKDSRLSESKDGKQIRWILLSPLIPGCDFEKLIQNARKSDYQYDTLFLYGDFIFRTNVTIPSGIPTFFISDRDGNQLLEKYSHPKSYFVTIEESFDWYLFLVGVYDTIIATIWKQLNLESVLYAILLLYVGWQIISKRFSNQHRRNRLPQIPDEVVQQIPMLRNLNALLWALEDNQMYLESTNRMRMIQITLLARLVLATRSGISAPDEILELPSLEWLPAAEEIEKCSICWENYKIGEVLNSLPCSHRCIQTWLTSANLCPLCRHPVRSERDTDVIMDRILQELI